jgi:hypothetical protein
MDWYIVIKTINGRRYKYRQKTWREGGRVRTRSEYIGPAGDGEYAKGRRRTPKHPDLTGATTLPIAFPSQSPFDSAVVDDVLQILTDPKAPPVWWSTPWDDNRSGEVLVQKQQHIEAVLKILGVKRSYRNDGAWYSPPDDTINMPPRKKFFDRPFETATHGYYSTLLHELTHWTKGPTRTGRKDNRTKPFGYAREELVAELGAMILMKHFGLVADDLRLHTDYFQGWLSRAGNQKVALKYAKLHAERAVRFILKRGIIRQ